MHKSSLWHQSLADLSSFASRSTRSLNPSSSLRMPHVFVVPPEEEQQDNPPWCCFDADQQPDNLGDLSNPSIHTRDIPCHFCERDAPLPISRTSTRQPKLRIPMSKKLEKKQRPEVIRIIENKSSHGRLGDPRDDSDVIEVVKVKRCRDVVTDHEENMSAKRSKTFRARATKALQSIKNVGKNSHRTHVKELWMSTESIPGIFKGVREPLRTEPSQTATATLPSKKGSLSRTASRSLSQIFQPMRPSPPESAFTLRVPSPVGHPTPNTVSPHFTSNINLSTLTIDDALHRPGSGSLKSSTKRSLNAKFSVRELHRLFSFSSSPDEPPPVPCPTTIPSLPVPCTLVPPSTLDSRPDLPAAEDMPTDPRFLSVESAERRRYDPVSRPHQDDDAPPRPLSDVSFEMKLDSLHFDSLSFDADDFDVPMEGNDDILW